MSLAITFLLVTPKIERKIKGTARITSMTARATWQIYMARQEKSVLSLSP